MAEKRYSFAINSKVDEKLDRVDVAIVKWGSRVVVNYWNLIRRLSRFWLIYWNETPGAVLKFRDHRVEMTPGKMILIPPYTLVSAETRAPFVHNYVEFEAAPPFNQVKTRPLEFPAAEFAPSLPPGTDRIHLSLALYILAERLLLEVPQDNLSSSGRNLFEPRIQTVLKYMDHHPMKKYSIAELAKQVSLSESRLLHLFKKEPGITPRDYWLKQRMELILRLLDNTDMTIPEIAEETGFTDRSHLSRIFKETFGQTPAAIRKKIHAVRKNGINRTEEN